MYSSIKKNKINTILIFTMFVVLISAMGGVFSWVMGEWLIFAGSLIGGIIYISFNYFLSSAISTSMAGAEEAPRSEYRELYSIVEAISMTAGMPMPKVYVMSDPSPNAFASGISPDKSLVCVSTGLLDIMSKSEIEGVIAHEVAHIKNYDIRLSMMAMAATSLIGFLADVTLRMSFYGGSDNKDDENRSLFSGIIGLIAAILSPIIAMVIQMAISREREYLADATAVMITRNPAGMIGALQKLKDFSAPMQRQNRTMANLYISNPLSSDFMDNLFSTHPPLEKRIERLKENSQRF